MASRLRFSSVARLKNVPRIAGLLLVLVATCALLGWSFAVPPLPTALFAVVNLFVFTAFIRFHERALRAAQEKIAHRERLYAVLSHCNQSIVHITDRDALFARICQIAVELGHFRMAWVGLANRKTQMIDPIAHAGGDDAFFERVKVSMRDEPLGRGPGATAFREGRTVVCNDARTDPRLQPWREDTLKRDFLSAAGFPLRSNGDPIGCFVLYAADLGFFDTEEVRLLEEMAADISFALRQIEREGQRRRIEEEKNRLSIELQLILDTVPAMIFYKDREHRLVRANAAMIRTLGKPPEKLIGRTDLELGTPYHAQYARDEDEIAATGQPKLGLVEPLMTPHGIRWLQTDKVARRDEAGNIIGFIGLAIDITERKAAEEALRASEADFRASFLSTAVGQVQADPINGRYLRVNPKFCDITGYSEEELLRMTFRDLTHPDDRAHDSVAHQAMVDGKISELSREKRYRRKDGKAVWVNISASIIRDEAGKPLRTLAVIRDISARRVAEDAQQAAESKYRTLVEQSLAGIYIVQDDVFAYVNPTLAELLGYRGDELIGRPVMEVIFPEDRPVVAENIRRRLTGDTRSIRYGLHMVRRDGSVFPVEVHGARTVYKDRPAILGTLLDLTERRKIEAQLLQSQKMEAIGQLAGGIAHDFNNLLAAITGNARLALEDLPDAHPARQFLGEIGKASARAIELVRRILTFSRQEPQERRIMKFQPVVEETLKLLQVSIPPTIEIRASYPETADPIFADQTQIQQVIMNLCANAIHAMGEKGLLEVRESVIDVDAGLARTSPDLHPGRYVHLCVSDSGCGMDRATLARIFDPFFTTKAQGEGTGLGLSVVHGIIKAHEGAITVYSEPGHGTAFHLYFPIAAGDTSPPEAGPATVPQGHGERILYVDDEEPLVFLTSQVLRRLGYEVTGFVDAEEALEAFTAEPHRFDVAISDLSMPRLSGRDLAQRLLQIRPDIPVVLVSGYLRPNDVQRAREIGVRDLVLKPDTVEELGRILHRILSEQQNGSVN
jgi:PAS domain S-box-containing protein